MTELCRDLFKMKLKEKLVEIMDLRLFSSLELDHVKKMGTSWAGPRLLLDIFLIVLAWYHSPFNKDSIVFVFNIGIGFCGFCPYKLNFWRSVIALKYPCL